MNTKPYTVHPSGYKTYSGQFKAELVARCLVNKFSVSSVAVQHGMNPNVLHRWISEHKKDGRHSLDEFNQSEDCISDINPAGANNWLAILPEREQLLSESKTYKPIKKALSNKEQLQESIVLELSTSNLTLKLDWPSANSSGLAQFIKELMA